MIDRRWNWIVHLTKEEAADLRATEAHIRWLKEGLAVATTKRSRIANTCTQRAKAAAIRTKPTRAYRKKDKETSLVRASNG